MDSYATLESISNHCDRTASSFNSKSHLDWRKEAKKRLFHINNPSPLSLEDFEIVYSFEKKILLLRIVHNIEKAYVLRTMY